MKIGQRLISTCLVVAALSAASAGGRYAWDEGEKSRCASIRNRIEAPMGEIKSAPQLKGVPFSDYLDEAVRRGWMTREEIGPDGRAYLDAKAQYRLSDPLWCQKKQSLKWWFYAPGITLLGLAGLAILLAAPLALLYAIVRVIKLAWR